MQRGAIVQEVAALHVSIGKPHPLLKSVSVSTQIAALRRLLYGWESSEKQTGHWFKQAAEVRCTSRIFEFVLTASLGNYPSCCGGR